MVHLRTFLKTFFVTLLLVVALEFGFWWYMKLFNKDLWQKVAWLIYKCETTVVQTTTTTGDIDLTSQIQWLWEKIQSLQSQLEKVGSDVKNISSDSDNSEAKINIPVSNWQTSVKLYYFNQDQDNNLTESQKLNTSSVIPVQRTISSSNNLIKDTINLLLQWQLTKEEVALWFQTQFPNKDFFLKNLTLNADGSLVLEMSEVPWFTSGWSARQILLKVSIEKTAKQFPEVKSVKFVPETLFQP